MKRNPIYWHTLKARRMCDIHGDTVRYEWNDKYLVAVCSVCGSELVIVEASEERR